MTAILLAIGLLFVSLKSVGIMHWPWWIAASPMVASLLITSIFWGCLFTFLYKLIPFRHHKHKWFQGKYAHSWSRHGKHH